jgi:hypothetical protein
MQLRSLAAWVTVAPLLALPTVTEAQTVSNPSQAPDCMNNTAFYNPTLPPSAVYAANGSFRRIVLKNGVANAV